MQLLMHSACVWCNQCIRWERTSEGVEDVDPWYALFPRVELCGVLWSFVELCGVVWSVWLPTWWDTKGDMCVHMWHTHTHTKTCSRLAIRFDTIQPFAELTSAPSPSMQIVIEPKSFPLLIWESLLARGQSFCEALSGCLLLFFVPRSHIKAVFTGSLCHFFPDRM